MFGLRAGKRQECQQWTLLLGQLVTSGTQTPLGGELSEMLNTACSSEIN